MKDLKFKDVLEFVIVIVGFIGAVIGAIVLFKADTQLAAIKAGFLFLVAAIILLSRKK